MEWLDFSGVSVDVNWFYFIVRIRRHGWFFHELWFSKGWQDNKKSHQSLDGSKTICKYNERWKQNYTFGRVSKYDSGTSISAKALLFIAIAALRIWLVHSRLCCKCFLEFSWRPPGGTRGTGSHHFSSWRWRGLRKEPEPSESGATIPWSTYQNSVSLKLSNISC